MMQTTTCGYSDAEFVSIYDACIAESFVNRLLPIIDALVLRHIPPHSHVLDLCCGSGNLAHRLCISGYRVTGIDNSAAMLERARHKMPEATFIQEDARCLRIDQRFEAAFCTFNALAHFSSAEELRKVFSAVHSCLSPAGLFFFDLSTEQAYSERWCGSFGSTHHGTDWQVEPRYDHGSRTAHNRITLKSGDRASELNVTQHCFRHDEIAAALLATGFQQFRASDAATLGLGIPDESGRLIFVAQK